MYEKILSRYHRSYWISLRWIKCVFDLFILFTYFFSFFILYIFIKYVDNDYGACYRLTGYDFRTLNLPCNNFCFNHFQFIFLFLIFLMSNIFSLNHKKVFFSVEKLLYASNFIKTIATNYIRENILFLKRDSE
jgi:hypothetical protein